MVRLNLYISIYIILFAGCKTVTDKTSALLSNTPLEFQTVEIEDKKSYERDKLNIIREIDSLLSIYIIEEPANYAHRYFNGIDYQDTIKRSFAIDLPPKIVYTKIEIDTLFYLKNGINPSSGFFIGEYKAADGMRYHGQAFIYYSDKKRPYDFLETSFYAFDKLVTKKNLIEYYLNNRSKEEHKYNVNDIRLYNK